MSLLRRHSALAALVTAGLLWGLTVPLSKLALEWLEGGWLTVARFALAAPLLAFVARRHLRAALTPRIVFAGAVGYGLVIVLQNAGIERTSVSHASLIVGAVPALVALVAAVSGRAASVDRAGRAWLGFALALGGVAIVAGGGGGAASLSGDALVLASVMLSATFVVIQPSLLRGRDPMAVTAVQMVAGGLAAVPNAALEGLPAAPSGAAPVLALARARDRRHAGAVRAVRLRAVARGAGACRGVPQPRADRRHGRGGARVRRPVRRPCSSPAAS